MNQKQRLQVSPYLVSSSLHRQVLLTQKKKTLQSDKKKLKKKSKKQSIKPTKKTNKLESSIFDIIFKTSKTPKKILKQLLNLPKTLRFEILKFAPRFSHNILNELTDKISTLNSDLYQKWRFFGPFTPQLTQSQIQSYKNSTPVFFAGLNDQYHSIFELIEQQPLNLSTLHHSVIERDQFKQKHGFGIAIDLDFEMISEGFYFNDKQEGICREMAENYYSIRYFENGKGEGREHIFYNDGREQICHYNRGAIVMEQEFLEGYVVESCHCDEGFTYSWSLWEQREDEGKQEIDGTQVSGEGVDYELDYYEIKGMPLELVRKCMKNKILLRFECLNRSCTCGENHISYPWEEGIFAIQSDKAENDSFLENLIKSSGYKKNERIDIWEQN